MRGIVGIISLLLGVLIMVIFFVFVGTKLLQKDEEAVTSANPKDVQKTVDELQNKIQEDQKNTIETNEISP